MENENSQQMAGETKQAETRLKEMSRKAKQKGKEKPSTKLKNTPPLFNQNWFYIGIGLAAIGGTTYLIYKNSKSETQPELRPMHRDLQRGPAKQELQPEATRFEKNEVKTPSFELNSFLKDWVLPK